MASDIPGIDEDLHTLEPECPHCGDYSPGGQFHHRCQIESDYGPHGPDCTCGKHFKGQFIHEFSPSSWRDGELVLGISPCGIPLTNRTMVGHRNTQEDVTCPECIRLREAREQQAAFEKFKKDHPAGPGAHEAEDGDITDDERLGDYAILTSEPDPRLSSEENQRAKEIFERSSLPFTLDEVLQVLRNSGVDVRCGACAEVAFTGSTTNKHTCPRGERHRR